MELLKVFYSKERGGFLLFTPDGDQLPCVQRAVVDDQWDGSNTGGRVLVTVTLQAEVVNDMPTGSLIAEARISGSDIAVIMKRVEGNQPGSKK